MKCPKFFWLTLVIIVWVWTSSSRDLMAVSRTIERSVKFKADPQTLNSAVVDLDRSNGLANTDWKLLSFNEAGTVVPVTEGTSVTLKFGGEGRASGTGSCNTFAADYQVQNEKITFIRLISTKKACLDEALAQQEKRYFQALGSADKFKLNNDRLTISYDGGRSQLNFVKMSSTI